MKTLYLLRHAHTLSTAPQGLGDHERGLSPRGIDEARKIGMFMREHNINPDLVLTSSSARTTQTARLILNTLFHEIDNSIVSRPEHNLYQASARKILNEIQKTNDSIHRLMLIGHNPGISELIANLDNTGKFPRFESVATGTLVVFKAKCQNWKDFSSDLASIEMFFAPQDAS